MSTTEVTLDPRYRSRLEQELSQADEGIKSRDEIIARMSGEVGPVRAENARLKPLADAALEHRAAAAEATKAEKALAKKLSAAEARIAGLQEHLDKAEQKAPRIEEELAEYDDLDGKIAQASSILDLFSQGA